MPSEAASASDGIFARVQTAFMQPKDGEPWQGVVPLEGGGIAQMLVNYMKRSEQLDTLSLIHI